MNDCRTSHFGLETWDALAGVIILQACCLGKRTLKLQRKAQCVTLPAHSSCPALVRPPSLPPFLPPSLPRLNSHTSFLPSSLLPSLPPSFRSSRNPLDRMKTLWCSWAVLTDENKKYGERRGAAPTVRPYLPPSLFSFLPPSVDRINQARVPIPPSLPSLPSSCRRLLTAQVSRNWGRVLPLRVAACV